MSRLDENSVTRNIPRVGYLVAIGAPVSWASANIIARVLVTDPEMNVPPLVASSFSMSFGLMIMIIIALKGLAKDIKPSNKKAILMASVAGLIASGGNLALFFALREAEISVVIPIVATQGLFTIIVSRIAIRRLERITPRLLFGSGLVLVGVILIARAL